MESSRSCRRDFLPRLESRGTLALPAFVGHLPDGVRRPDAICERSTADEGAGPSPEGVNPAPPRREMILGRRASSFATRNFGPRGQG